MEKEQKQAPGKNERASMTLKSKTILFLIISLSIFSFSLFAYYSYLSFQSLPNRMSKRSSTFISLNIILLFLLLLSKSSNTRSSMEYLPSEPAISTSFESVELHTDLLMKRKLAIDEASAYSISCMLETEECDVEDKKCIVVVEEVEEIEVNVVLLNEEGDEELALLGLDELNERFEAFIRKEKSKWMMEAMKVGNYPDNETKLYEVI